MKRIAIAAIAIALATPSLADGWDRHENGGWGRGAPYYREAPPPWTYALPPRLYKPPPYALPYNLPPAIYPCDTAGRGTCGPGSTGIRRKAIHPPYLLRGYGDGVDVRIFGDNLGDLFIDNSR